MKASLVALGVSLVANGVMAVFTSLYVVSDQSHQEREKKLEADVRKYAGKYLDIQETVQDNEDRLKAESTMLKFQLEECMLKVKK